MFRVCSRPCRLRVDSARIYFGIPATSRSRKTKPPATAIAGGAIRFEAGASISFYHDTRDKQNVVVIVAPALTAHDCYAVGGHVLRP
jgi:hypothetical protein